MDVNTQPQTLSEVLSSPNPASSEQGPTMSTTSVVTSLSTSSAITSTASNAMDIKPEIKMEIKTEVSYVAVALLEIVRDEQIRTRSALQSVCLNNVLTKLLITNKKSKKRIVSSCLRLIILKYFS